jgi:hypothetical protein
MYGIMIQATIWNENPEIPRIALKDTGIQDSLDTHSDAFNINFRFILAGSIPKGGKIELQEFARGIDSAMSEFCYYHHMAKRWSR